MNYVSNLPIIRNYLFLRKKVSEQSAHLVELRNAINESEKKITELRQAQFELEQRWAEFGSNKSECTQSIDEALAAQQIAQKYDVVPVIHAEDHIFRFVKTHERFAGDTRAALDYYFSTGRESAEKLVAIKNEVGRAGKCSLLEFASGYGCVTRHLTQFSSEFSLTACDIHPDAVRFITEKLQTPCLGSVNQPEDFVLEKQYGMVFALSFFSHMPRRTWGRWLAALYRAVEPGGHLIFTTHGLVSQRKMIPHAEVDATGFWFNENSEQSDLDTVEYGSTITTPDFVRREIAKLDGATEVGFHEGHWWTHQDAWVVRKR